MDGDVSHEDGERRAAGLDYREGSPAAAASRSEEEDRELVLRRRGPTALDLRLLRRRQVAFVDASLEVETLDAVRRDEARRGALRRRGEPSKIAVETVQEPAIALGLQGLSTRMTAR